MTKGSKKVRSVFFVSKFWEDKVTLATVIYYLQVFLYVLVEFQSSFQDLTFIGVLLSRGNLALITRDPFQLLKGLLLEYLKSFLSQFLSVKAIRNFEAQ